MKKTTILWFSRHSMTQNQLQDLRDRLGEIEVTHVSGSPQNVHVPFTATAPEQGETVADKMLVGELVPLKDLVKGFDELAAVLPIGLQQQILPFTSGRILQAKNARIIEDGGKVTFSHVKWEQVTEIKIVVEDL